MHSERNTDGALAGTPTASADLSRCASLQIPEPAARPGAAPDFRRLSTPPPSASVRPEVDADPASCRDLAYGLIRVLDDEGSAAGAWNPSLSPETKISALRKLLLTRAFDQRMYRAQRAGKTSFYMKSSGEEAVSIGAAMALEKADMCFPTYRQQGLLIGRDYSMVDMMCQVFSNARDPLKGRQMPVFYSSREYGFFSISGNLGTQYSQAAGWAMAAAYKKDPRIASAWIGEGATAEGDFHYALTFAAVYKAPVILNIVNNQWAISSFHGIAGGLETTFAARGIGVGLPSLRVDGNDLLAVYAVTHWAAERARRRLGATVIELVTYRQEGHSTSDDPSRYRPVEEPGAWPLGDPVTRLHAHLVQLGVWNADQQARAVAEAEEAVKAAGKEAESYGTLGSGQRPGLSTMFDDVYAEMPWHIRAQRQQMGV